MDGAMGTQDKVLYFGKQEFLQSGFQDASLRNIAAAAGMTTGAIYTYFKDKNALFEAIVDPVCKRTEEIFEKIGASYYSENTINSEISTQKAIADLIRIYGFIYENYDVFRMLIVGAQGSSKADYVHTIVNLEVAHTIAYLQKMAEAKKTSIRINRTVIHIVAESFIDALFEPVRHGMPYDQAVENLELLVIFYTGGWQSVFRELFGEKNI